jgi:hypothetical protein
VKRANVAPATLVHGTLSHKLLLFGASSAAVSHLPDVFGHGAVLGIQGPDLILQFFADFDLLRNLLSVSQLFLGRRKEAFFALEQNLFPMRLQVAVSEGFGAGLR